MLSAAQANKIATENSLKYNTVDSLEEAEKRVTQAIKMGFTNTGFDANINCVGKIIQTAQSLGYRVFADVNSRKDYIEVELEWF